ncbi:hypothetical protein SpCBS45565_g01098 [Spizellomyces sp. 'palustris']|nr:hypothetical protein SpCBS45565_g01098 [Spizellomyces sp. 'palustris']
MKATTWTIGVAFFASISNRVGAQSVVLGGACDAAQDVFGCQGKNYMACDPTSKRWILQNLCPTDCLGIPSFAQNCGRNTHGIEEPGTNPNPSPTTTTPTPPTTTTIARPSTRPSTTVPSIPVSTVPVSVSPNVTPVAGIVPTPPITPNPLPPASSASPASSSTKAPIWILAPTLVVTLALGTLLVLVYRRRKTKFPDPETQKPIFTPTLASVLEKRYVVVHPYVPAVNDEIALSTGDVVRLFLLFDDGWAKGVNEATGQTGLLPCACIEELSPPSHSPLAATPTTYSTTSVSSITPVLPSSSSSPPR